MKKVVLGFLSLMAIFSIMACKGNSGWGVYNIANLR